MAEVNKNQADATLPADDLTEVTFMAELVCSHCGKQRELRLVHSQIRPGEGADIIRGVLNCLACNKPTPFGMRNNAINFYPAGEHGALNDSSPTLVREMFSDAEMCLFGAGYRGVAAMARAAVEEALEHRGFNGRLEEQIEAAKSVGALDEHEYMLAHGSRLAGNAALHKAETLDPGVVTVALSAAVVIVNHLYP